MLQLTMGNEQLTIKNGRWELGVEARFGDVV